MSLPAIFIIFLIILIGCYIIYKYVEPPVKTWLFWIIGVAITCWILALLGFWTWIAGVKV